MVLVRRNFLIFILKLILFYIHCLRGVHSVALPAPTRPAPSPSSLHRHAAPPPLPPPEVVAQ
jgi:hypothetical protein